MNENVGLPEYKNKKSHIHFPNVCVNSQVHTQHTPNMQTRSYKMYVVQNPKILDICLNY